MVTVSEAAREIGIYPARLFECIAKGVVSCQRYGNATLVDPEVARKELEANGFFERQARVLGPRRRARKAS